jgi:hypothetical protein
VRLKTVTFVVCSSIGLQVDGESVPYVAGWGEDGALEAVTEFAATIDGLARPIEDVLASANQAAGGAAASVRRSGAKRHRCLSLTSALAVTKQPKLPESGPTVKLAVATSMWPLLRRATCQSTRGPMRRPMWTAIRCPGLS